MSNTFKRVLSLLLVLVMVFSVFSVTVFAASNAEYGSVAADAAVAPEDKTDGTSGEGTATGGSFSREWIEVEYDDDNITVTLNPTKEGLLSMSAGDIKTLLSFLVEAVKKVVVEDLAEGLPGNGKETKARASYKDNDWYSMFNSYLVGEYPECKTEKERYDAFARDTISSDVKVNEFADFACTLVKAAFAFNNMELEELSDPANVEKKLKEIFDATIADNYERIPYIAEVIVDKYIDAVDTIEENKDNPINALSPMELIKLLDEIRINDLRLYGDTANGKSFVFGTLKYLIRHFPNFEDIANMSDDEMQISYDFTIKTAIHTRTDFTLTVKLGAQQDVVRKVASLIARNVSLEYLGNDGLVLDINVPDELAKAILKAANSTKIPDKIKHEVFGKIDYTPEEAFTFIKNTTFDKIIKLFEYVDFDNILDHDFFEKVISKIDGMINNEKIDGIIDKVENLTDEQIDAKIAEYEWLYNKALKILTNIYSYLPSELTEKNIFSIYDGNGVFSASIDKPANILDIIDKVSEKLLGNEYVGNVVDKVNDKLGKDIITQENIDRIKNFIDGFLDVKDFKIAIDATVKVNDIYKISYYVGSNEAYSEGFLPVGADVAYFANIKTYEGRTIIAWEARDPDGNLVTLDKMPAYDVKVAAIFAPDVIPEYDITFVVDGAFYASVTTTGNEAITLPAAPTKDGYTFDGWFFADGTEFTADYLIQNPITDNVIVEAVFTEIVIPDKEYTVDFKVDDQIYYTETVKENGTVTLPADPTAPVGKTFAGWIYADGTAFDVTAPITANTTVYAKFDVITYTVTFYVSGAIYATVTVNYGETVALPADPTVESGYTFAGWFNVDDTAFDASAAILADTEVFAKINAPTPEEETFTVVFKVDTTTYATFAVKKGELVTLPAAPTKEGYTFDGWYVDDSTAFDATAPITANTVVYAKFVAEDLTVTFKVDNSVYAEITVKYGETVTLPAAPTAPAGFTFVGWTYADNTAFDENAAITTDVVLVAKFVENEFRITFVVNNKTYHVMLTNGASVIVLPTAPEQDGKVFAGWFFADGSKLTTDSLVTSPINSNVVVVASFKAPDHVFGVQMGVGETADNNKPVTGNINTIYGEDVTLWVNFDGRYNPNYNYRFQWQIEIEVGVWADIDGATEMSYTVSDVDQSGNYRCVVTAYADENSTEALSVPTMTIAFVITVAKKDFSVDSYVDGWNNVNKPNVFEEGKEYFATLPEVSANDKDIIKVDYTGTMSAKDAGVYTVTAVYTIINGNYKFADGSTKYEVTFNWYINAAELNVNKVESEITPEEPKTETYKQNIAIEFNADEFIKIPASLAGIIRVEVIDGKLIANGVGKYYVTIRIYIDDANYTWDDVASASVDPMRKTAPKAGNYKDVNVLWCEIKPQDIDLSTLTWTSNDNGNFNFVFADKEYKVYLDTAALPEEIVDALVYSGNTVKYATDIAGVATVALDDAFIAALSDNYNFATDSKGNIKYPLGQKWEISKQVITADAIEWINNNGNTNFDFIYNGGAQFVTAKFNQNLLTFTLTYTDANGNEIKDPTTIANAGTYTVSIEIMAQDQDNYAVDGVVSAKKTFTIEKAELAHDGMFAWVGDADTMYNPDKYYVANFESAYTAAELAKLFTIDGATKMEWHGVGTKNASVTVKINDTDNYYFIVDGNVAYSNTYYFSVEITPYVVDISGFAGWQGVGSFEYRPSGYEANFNIDGMKDLRFINIALTVNGQAFDANSYSYVASIVGDYIFTATITLKDDVNFIFANGTQQIDGGTAALHISRAEISLKDVVWNDFTDPTFNDNAQNAPTINEGTLPVGVVLNGYVTTDRSGNAVTDLKNAGNYVTQVIIGYQDGFDASCYKITLDGFEEYKTWSIAPAVMMDTIIANGVTLGGASGIISIIEDGTPKSVEIEGTLPEGIEVLEYVITDMSGNVTQAVKVGTYKVTANFVCTNGNYSGTASMSATLFILSHEGTDYIAIDDEYNVVKVQVSTIIEFGHSIDFSVVTDIYKDLDFSAEITKYLNDGKKYNAELLMANDIGFFFNGAPTTVENNKFKVEMSMPKGFAPKDGETFFVVYVSNDGKEIEIIEATLNGGEIGGYNVAFDTDHFSVYGVISATEDNTPDTPVTPPVIDDGDDAQTANPSGFVIVSWWWLWIIIVVLLAIIVALIIILIKKSDDDDDDEPEVVPPAEPEAIEAPVEEAPVEEAPVEEAPVEEAPVEEAPVEEAPVEEAPVEEAPVEEAPVEEAPVAEPPAPGFYESLVAASENADAVRLVNGVVVPVRYRTSFMSRLIQAEPPIQDYYTIVKNYTLSFKGVKARTSWNFESFNKGRIQCIKLNVKGNAFQVYIGLDPAEYNEDKYHFVFVGDKPKLDKVPMMMKVKSERALKYTLELIDEVMSKNGIERGETPEVDYHMPYESTEALVDKDLVKVILPDGMEIDENTIIERVNVGDLLKDVKPEGAPVEEAPVEEAPVEEAPVEEAPVEEAPVEEAPVEEAPVEEAPVEEAPVEEAPVEEAPVEEVPVVHIVDHRVVEEDIVHVDAVKADVIVSDEQAEEFIESVTHGDDFKAKSNKCHEINLDTICENFENGDVVTIEALKKLGLISKKADRIKVLARGTMTKKVTVIADKFSIQAVKMIGLAGGAAQKYND